jgi:hypothetical protein
LGLKHGKNVRILFKKEKFWERKPKELKSKGALDFIEAPHFEKVLGKILLRKVRC